MYLEALKEVDLQSADRRSHWLYSQRMEGAGHSCPLSQAYHSLDHVSFACCHGIVLLGVQFEVLDAV